MSNAKQIRQLSTIFTSRHFKALHEDLDMSLIKNLHSKNYFDTGCETVLDSIKFSYKLLLKGYRNEFIFKNILFNKLLLGIHSPNTSTVINELRVGKSIADFVLFNGEAHIYEIKTGLDNLEKLSKQINDYKQFSSKISIVCDSEETEKVSRRYDSTNIGIIELTKRNTLRTVKAANRDSERLCFKTLFKTLRKKEVEDLLVDYFGFGIAVPNTKFFSTSFELVRNNIPILEFQSIVFEILKKRKPANQDSLKLEEVPNELNFLCYSQNLSSKGYERLSKILSCSI